MITLKYLVLGLTYSGFGLGYLLGLGMNRAAVAIVASDECRGFGHTRPENCWAIDDRAIDVCWQWRS